MNKKLVTIMAVAVVAITLNVTYAQPGSGQKRDPKAMTAMMADKLKFTSEQKTKLSALNEKYQGDDFDKKKYHEDFRQILTDEQRQKADEMRKEHRDDMEHKGNKSRK